MFSVFNKGNISNFPKETLNFFQHNRMDSKKDNSNNFAQKYKENQRDRDSSFIEYHTKENIPCSSNNISAYDLKNERAFGKDLSNVVQKPNIIEQRKCGRSLSVNISKPINHCTNKAKGDENFIRMSSMLVESFETNLEPIDQDNLNMPAYVAVYAKEIFEYLKETELRNHSKGNYLSSIQNDINEKMRSILIDWLVDVHLKFKLRPETLFMTVNLIDRYLEKAVIARQKLQLVGVASMLIACKYEEIYAPETKDFVYVTDKAYSKPEIHEMEGKILSALEFNINSNSPLKFLERYSRLDSTGEKGIMLSKYIMELSLIDYKMLKYSPSLIAASSLYLSNKILKKPISWSELLEKNTFFNENDVRICGKDLFILVQNANKSSLTAVKRKYGDSKFSFVSKIRCEQA